jgi:two-component system phosphate regulon response regulator PhoB
LTYRATPDSTAVQLERFAQHVLGTATVEIDFERREVRRAGRLVKLSPTEFNLLAVLMRRPAETLTRGEILEIAHGSPHAATPRAVDVQVMSIRRKLGPAGAQLETVRGRGYRFRPA